MPETEQEPPTVRYPTGQPPEMPPDPPTVRAIEAAPAWVDVVFEGEEALCRTRS